MALKLDLSFYQRKEVVKIARELLGKVLITNVEGVITSGRIVETEAYSFIERGCHAFKGKTPRNAVMFDEGGQAYVYLCYGIHHLFNIVTNEKGKADAVLIRALEPLQGTEHMMSRMNVKTLKGITSGPGKLTKAMGININFNGMNLKSSFVWLEDDGLKLLQRQIEKSPRIGIDYAGEDALLPWRFAFKENPWVSKTKKGN